MTRFKNFFVYSILVLALSFSPSLSHAQPGPPDPCGDPTDPLCPIDGGVSFLIAGVIGIAARKAYKEKQQQGS